MKKKKDDALSLVLGKCIRKEAGWECNRVEDREGGSMVKC